MKEMRKILFHHFKGQLNYKSQRSKGVVKGQGVQRYKERSKLVKFIL